MKKTTFPTADPALSITVPPHGLSSTAILTFLTVSWLTGLSPPRRDVLSVTFCRSALISWVLVGKITPSDPFSEKGNSNHGCEGFTKHPTLRSVTSYHPVVTWLSTCTITECALRCDHLLVAVTTKGAEASVRGVVRRSDGQVISTRQLLHFVFGHLALRIQTCWIDSVAHASLSITLLRSSS